MKKRVLLSTLLLGGAIAFSATSAFAAPPSATNTVTATLNSFKTVTADGLVLDATMNPSNGSLSATMTPRFKLMTNTNIVNNLTLTATCPSEDTGGVSTALFGDGSGTGTFICLGNESFPPSAAAVTNAKKIPTVLPGDANPNVVAYAVTPPADDLPSLDYTWNGTNGWNVAYKGPATKWTTVTIQGTPTPPKTNTFESEADLAGAYKATLTYSYTS